MEGSSKIRYTYRDYLSIPEYLSGRHEIVDGELFVTPTPSVRHQEVVGNLICLLADLSDAHDLGQVVLGPIAVRLHEEGVVEPDVIFIRKDRLGIVNSEGVVDGPPDLVVEVLSPSNRDYDRTLKRKECLAYGVEELWLVDADEETVEVWRSGAKEPEVVEDALIWRVDEERFRIPLEEVFRGVWGAG